MTRTRLGLALGALFAAGTLFYPAIIQAQGLGVSSARDIPDEVQKAQPRVDQVIERAEAYFKQGKLKNDKHGKAAGEADGTFIQFEPDPEIFKKFEMRDEFVERRLRHYSYLNTGLKLIFNGKTFQVQYDYVAGTVKLMRSHDVVQSFTITAAPGGNSPATAMMNAITAKVIDVRNVNIPAGPFSTRYKPSSLKGLGSRRY